jgi:phosphoenolpyruvate carboxykinase (GTP)
MLILKLTNPNQETKYITGAFPSACGKTNLAMINPTLKGWKAETIGDDIAWLHLKDDGRLYAINPEAGFFGVASGTSKKTNPHAIETVSKDTIFTNVALTDDGDVWWDDLTEEVPNHLIDWKGQDWYKGMDSRPDHPNGRFTSALTNCPNLAENYEEPVPISAILFGGRRPTTIPLIHQSFNFDHGIFIGSIMGSEITAATIDDHIGHVRRDPFAMLPFIGYNISDYVNHWSSFKEKTSEDQLPKIFYVNWFRKDDKGYIWPGFGDNIRVLSWIWDRTENKNNYVHSAIGLLPDLDAFNFEGLNVDLKRMETLFEVDRSVWLNEIKNIEKYYQQLYAENLPDVLKEQLELLKQRINDKH